MNILLAFTPFVTFAILNRFVGMTGGLVLGTLVALALVIYGVVVKKQSAKILEVGTLFLFLGLTLYTGILTATWSAVVVRLCVDGGLLAIVLFSLLIRKPFTMQYARETVAPEFWDSSQFIHTNYVITGAWACAFLAIVAFDVVMVVVPKIPLQAGIAVAVVALLAAMRFSSWYPDQAHARA
jgi:hypothetical protein